MFYSIGYVISHLMILLIKLSEDLGLEIRMSATTQSQCYLLEEEAPKIKDSLMFWVVGTHPK